MFDERIADPERRYICARGHVSVTRYEPPTICSAPVLSDGSMDLYMRGPSTPPRLCGAEIVRGPLVYDDNDELIDGIADHSGPGTTNND